MGPNYKAVTKVSHETEEFLFRLTTEVQFRTPGIFQDLSSQLKQ